MNISIESIRDFFEYYYYRSYCYWIKKKTVGPESVAIATIAIPIGAYLISIALFLGLRINNKETFGIFVAMIYLIIYYFLNENSRNRIMQKFSSRTNVNEKYENWRCRINLVFYFFSHLLLWFSMWVNL